MRVRFVLTAIAVLASAPVWAQTNPTLTPRAVLPSHVMCADLLVPALPLPGLRIAGSHHPEPRLALNRDDLAVVHRMPEDGLAVGQRYLVRRMPRDSESHLPKEGGLVPVRTLGWLTITALDDANAMARIDHACDAIEPDDYLVAYVEPVLPSPAAALPPADFTERVQVLPGPGGRQMFGDGDHMSLARGSDDGVVVGARYAIYRDRKDGKPLVHVGEVVVTDPSATTSKAIVTRVLGDAVEVTDIAVPRR